MASLLGIEIGGTKLQLGLGAGDGEITRLLRRNVDVAAGAAGIRSQIVDAVRELGVEIDAVGVGFGGPVDSDRGTIITSNQIDGWTGFPLVEWLQSSLGVSDVTLQNDADTAALGEALFGAGRGLSPILYVNSGSGIGGGLIVDGKIYRGSGHGAIEIGHLWMVEAGEGQHVKPATLEMVASGWSIARAGRLQAEDDLRRGVNSGILAEAGCGPQKVSASTIAVAARLGSDENAVRILARAAMMMGRALAHAVTLLAPKRVILGGGVSLIDDDLWLEPIRATLDERVFPPFRGTFDVVSAQLREDVVVHGALSLARTARD